MINKFISREERNSTVFQSNQREPRAYVDNNISSVPECQGRLPQNILLATTQGRRPTCYQLLYRR